MSKTVLYPEHPGKSRALRNARSPLLKKATSSLPKVPTALYTKELFEKSDEAIDSLKDRRILRRR